MTTCDCGCSTLGPNHDADARHPRPRSCKHDEEATVCPHGRQRGMLCPWCLGINVTPPPAMTNAVAGPQTNPPRGVSR